MAAFALLALVALAPFVPGLEPGSLRPPRRRRP